MLSSAVALVLQVLAQAAPGGDAPPGDLPGQGGAGQGAGFMNLILIGGMVLVMWLFVFRPQNKREQEEKSMLEKLKKDDHVVTKGGLFGVVVNVKDDEVTLRIDENNGTKVRFKKDAIASILTDDDKKKADGKTS